MTEEETAARLAAVRVQLLRSQQSAQIIAEHVMALELAGVRLPFPRRVAQVLADLAAPGGRGAGL